MEARQEVVSLLSEHKVLPKPLVYLALTSNTQSNFKHTNNQTNPLQSIPISVLMFLRYEKSLLCTQFSEMVDVTSEKLVAPIPSIKKENYKKTWKI